MRKKKDKKQLLTNLIEKFNKSKGYVLFSLLGLEASLINSFRLKSKENQSLLEVPKKTLLYKANPNFPFEDNELKEPFAILWCFDEELRGIKIFKDFKEETEIKIIGGVFFENKFKPEEVWEIINLPEKKVLEAKLLNVLSFPYLRLQFALNSPMKKLIFVLSAIKK